uniref:Putative vitamin B12-binding domain containing protein n=1 Tax=viral metagenome TaxID=1070528 RepID=A0A6M3IUK7_9ZZZZ
MKILLINPIARAWAQPNVVPLGLGYIASVLRNKGHEINVLDWNAHRWEENEFVARLRLQEYPDIVGLTGIITQYGEVKRIANWCDRLWVETAIICGGTLASTVPELLLRKTKVNYCVLGEGEQAIQNFIDMVSRGFLQKEIRIFSESPIKDLSTIPWPAYDLFPMDIYLKNPIGPHNPNKWKDGKGEAPLTTNIIGSRGCPNSCIYCLHCFQDQGYRVRPYNDIILEMDFLQRTYGVNYIQFVDDAFACIKKHVLDFCCAFKGRDMTWSCAGRANLVDEEMVKAMADAGCIGLWYGLESGSQKMLDGMNKKITIKQYEKAIELNRKYFQYEDYTFIIGSPGETDETIQESIVFCKRMDIIPTAAFFMTPYPGTPLFKMLMMEDPEFRKMALDIDKFEDWILTLNEQGEKMAWNCSMGVSDGKVYEWHQRFMEETDAMNKIKH